MTIFPRNEGEQTTANPSISYSPPLFHLCQFQSDGRRRPNPTANLLRNYFSFLSSSLADGVFNLAPPQKRGEGRKGKTLFRPSFFSCLAFDPQTIYPSISFFSPSPRNRGKRSEVSDPTFFRFTFLYNRFKLISIMVYLLVIPHVE